MWELGLHKSQLIDAIWGEDWQKSVSVVFCLAVGPDQHILGQTMGRDD